MERKRYTADVTTVSGEDSNDNDSVDFDSTDKHLAVKGYKKTAIILFIFTLVTLFRECIFDVVSVTGNSMKDNFLQGDILIVEKYDTSNIQRFDVVIAKMKTQKIIKRVIGLPGETIQIKNGSVYINDERIKKEFDFYTKEAGIASEYFTLGKDEYFLLGDNRGESADSRECGAFRIKDIQGIVTLKIYPFSDAKIIPHGDNHKNEKENGENV